MSRRRIEIDDDVLDEARRVLGTSTDSETVNFALAETVKAARRRAITREDLRRAGKALRDLGDPDVMAGAWD